MKLTGGDLKAHQIIIEYILLRSTSQEICNMGFVI